MSDDVKIQLITSVVTMVGTCFSGLMAYLLARLNRDQSARAALANEKTDAVRDALVVANSAATTRIGDLAEVARQTHSLVNGKMAAQLKLNAELARRLAALTGSPADALAAETAAAHLEAHRADEADAGGPAPSPSPPSPSETPHDGTRPQA